MRVKATTALMPLIVGFCVEGVLCQDSRFPGRVVRTMEHAIPEAEVIREPVDLVTEDKERLLAIQYSRGDKNPKIGCVIMHPAGDSRRDWRLPYFARAGIVGLGMASRYHNDVAHEIYEEILLDIAAGVKHLREKVGVEKVFLLGHSGGGSLMTFYAHQSPKKPGQRIRSTVAGDPPDLNKYELPPVDLLIVSAAHYGAGWALVRKIDPSVTDENDPTSLDPSLDMYNPANGFNTPPEPSRYSKEFLARYRKAQEGRAWRLVEQARSYVADKKLHEELMKQPGFKDLPLYEQIKIQRKAITQRYTVIYRLLAIPQFMDLSLDPSDREVGSNVGPRPDLDNYRAYFHPSFITPEALLDSEGPSSRVHLVKQIKEVTIPTLFICGTADLQEYTSERREMYEASGAKMKDMVWIEGANHPYLPQGPKRGDGKQRDLAAGAMVHFIRKAIPGLLAD
ncbi:MAG: alpha/beta fold hydrolase [Acidobacteria bacterium]|nr:alpha/beta fold hydrolase [Acidobacteriota bacterium]